MDLRLFGSVLWRFRLIAIVGLALATALAFFSAARVGKSGISYRRPATYASTATIFFTQRGVSAAEQRPTVAEGSTPPNYLPALMNPNGLSANAPAYASIASSDAVKRLMLRHGPVHGVIAATALTTPGLGTPLPFLTFSGLADSPEHALETSKRGIAALRQYFQIQQATSVPREQQIVLQVLNAPRGATLVAGHSFTRPIVVFLAAAMAVIGLVLVLENLRPRIRSVPAAQPSVTRRRSA